MHGSAPDIAGQGIANPIGQIWCGAMMLDFLGHRDAHDAILAAIETVLDPSRGAPAHARPRRHARRTADLGRAVAEALSSAQRCIALARAVKHVLHER